MMLIGGAVQFQPQLIGHLYLVDGDIWTLLPPLPGFTIAQIGNLSNSGTVVGRSFQPIPRATIWQQAQPRNLNDLIPPDSGFVLEYARGIA
jgi:hypothetical protein